MKEESGVGKWKGWKEKGLCPLAKIAAALWCHIVCAVGSLHWLFVRVCREMCSLFHCIAAWFARFKQSAARDAIKADVCDISEAEVD